MKTLLPALLGFLLLLSFVSSAQDFDVPKKLPSSKKEFVKSEPDFISAAKWLENNAVDTLMSRRIRMNAWALAWITNAPAVTIILKSSFINLFDNNTHLMFVYMAGYARYCLENNYSKDELQANMAGVKSAIHCYKLGGHVTNNEAFNKVIDADKEGKLEDWVREAMNSK